MSLATQLMRAQPIGVKELKNDLCAVLKRGKTRVVTDRNKPKHFLIPYEEMIEIVELLEELSDRALMRQIAEGRKSYRAGKGIPIETTARDLGLKA